MFHMTNPTVKNMYFYLISDFDPLSLCLRHSVARLYNCSI